MWNYKNCRKSLDYFSIYRVEGRNIPILLNKLKNNNVEVKNVKKISEKVTHLTIKHSDSEKFFAIIDNMWYNKKIKDTGVLYPFFYLIQNIGILIGAIFLILSMTLSNDIVFNVSFSGTGSIYERELLEKLETEGVTTFSRFSKINLNELSNKLLMDNNNINYVSLKKQGNTLKVNAVKKTEKTNIDSKNKTEFVCSVDGVLENLIVYRGTSVVNVGERVKQGDILVKGEVIIKEQFVNVNVLATARIICDYSFTYETNDENQKDYAILLAKEVLNKECVSESVNITKQNEKYIYVVNLKYRTIICA